MSRRNSFQDMENENSSQSPFRSAYLQEFIPSMMRPPDVHQRPVPLPGLTPASRSLHASPLHMATINNHSAPSSMHGFINPLGPAIIAHGLPPSGVVTGMSPPQSGQHSPRQGSFFFPCKIEIRELKKLKNKKQILMRIF